jgi:Fe-S-cluster-containing dehydrogenase component
MTSPDMEREPNQLPHTADEIFDDAWEARARATLEANGWDADLAIRAARDALAVLAGELTEDEFHDRYHEAYLREFGVDLRPREDAADATPDSETTAGTTGAGAPAADADAASVPAVSRRTAMAMAGTGVAALLVGDLLSTRAQQATGQQGHGAAADTGHGAAGGTHRPRMGMVIDLERCDGCLMCVAACKKAYGLPDGVHWLYVLAYKEPERPNAINLLVRPCQHCSNAPCVKVCPTSARHRREDGLVLTDYDICFGCRYCQVACPYGVNYFGWSDPNSAGGGFDGERRDGRGRNVIGAPPTGVMGKCIYCPGRQDSIHAQPSTHCSVSCPMGVIHYGDLNDPTSEPMQYLEKRMTESGGRLSTFRLLEELGTEPNVIYIGHRPSRKAVASRGPTRYEDWGLVDARRVVLEGPEPWFNRMFGR